LRTYRITLDGKTPLIMHSDNIEWSDRMERWKLDPNNRAKSKPGDDRTPPFRWLGGMYHDGTHIVVPSDNIMRCLMSGGALTPTGKGQKTFKAQTQSGMMAPDLYWPLLVNGKPIPVAEILTDFERRSWEDWNELVTRLGFMLYVKRAKIGQSKHVRVRPRFDRWSVTGTLVVMDEAITQDVLMKIGSLAGQYAGLCEWRPGGKTPGPHGMFEMSVTKA
jgi:hypothetical protein